MAENIHTVNYRWGPRRDSRTVGKPREASFYSSSTIWFSINITVFLFWDKNNKI